MSIYQDNKKSKGEVFLNMVTPFWKGIFTLVSTLFASSLLPKIKIKKED